MPKLPRLTAKQAISLVLSAGFVFKRQSGSHKIYKKGNIRVTIPLHSNGNLHPKIVKSILEDIERAG